VSRYAGKPERFAATLAPVMPLMDYVLTEAEAHGLPSEVMLVPIIESYYRADARGPAGAMGMWQLMPDTGRRFGLGVRGALDDRLDVHASTEAALRLLELNADAFSNNPKLMFAAYNAGAYRLRKALAGREYASLNSLHGLGLTRTTHDYIDKLKALGCLLGEPERFGMQLPTLANDARLLEFHAPYPIDPHALAQRAGVPAASLKTWNQRAFARGATDASAPMLLPAGVLDAVTQAVAQGDLPKAAPRAAPTTRAAASVGRVHRVASGDSLWTISKRYRVQVADLMRWNGLNQRSVLRIGQTLVVADNT
jgi:membrane-bound lytic murein transglycosylase D